MLNQFGLEPGFADTVSTQISRPESKAQRSTRQVYSTVFRTALFQGNLTAHNFQLLQYIKYMNHTPM